MLKDMVARGRPMAAPGTIPQPQTPPPGPPAGAPGTTYQGTFGDHDLAGSMPSLGHPMRDAASRLQRVHSCCDSAAASNSNLTQVRLEIWRVAPAVLLELDDLRLDDQCMRVARTCTLLI